MYLFNMQKCFDGNAAQPNITCYKTASIVQAVEFRTVYVVFFECLQMILYVCSTLARKEINKGVSCPLVI